MKRHFLMVMLAGVGAIQSVSMGQGEPALTKTLVFEPSRTPVLSIRFDYTFGKAPGFFKHEPEYKGKEIARGWIPTVPPTPYIRNMTDHKLYLNVSGDEDFVNGQVVTYKSQSEDGHHAYFQDVEVFTRRMESAPAAYKVDLFTYEHFNQGYLNVKTGWLAKMEAGGKTWTLQIVDNLDGQIDENDQIAIYSAGGQDSTPTGCNFAVPQTLFLENQLLGLDFRFDSQSDGLILKADMMEIRQPMGTLAVDAKGCKLLRLMKGRDAVVLIHPASKVDIPVGDYQLKDCVLEQDPDPRRSITFNSYNEIVSVKLDQSASLCVGQPLNNTVEASLDGNLMTLKYRLVGAGGEQYKYYNWEKRPRFAIYKGPFRIAGGAFPFG